jgi:hypothetical protein
MFMDWTEVLTVLMVVATNLTTVIVLHCHLDNKTDKTLSSIRDEIKVFSDGIRQEMKDFHGRLCAIEERNKK